MNAPHSKKAVEPQSAPQTPVQTTETAPVQERFLGVLAYLGPLFVAPFVKPKSPFCRFHANQGFVFFITLFVVLILSGLSWILSLLLVVGYLGVMVYAMYMAYQGKMWKIPVLSEIAEKINIVKLVDGWTVAPAGKTPQTPAEDSKKEEQV